MTNKYTEAFESFAPALSGQELELAIKKILDAGFEKNNTLEVKKRIHGCIDLTTLMGADTETKVAALADAINGYDGIDETLPNVAAICVYPNFVSTVRETLTDPQVRVACVSGAFPASQSFIEVKIAETALAVAAGADEVDIVLNLGKFLEGEYEEASEEIAEQKDACRSAHLKVILETGALKTPEEIQKAAILALYSGADFIKTSTGKEYPGASLEAAYTMCQVLKQYNEKHGKKCGIKLSGGIRTAEDAIKYYTIVEAILGDEWLTPELFRIGASSLVGALQEEILGK